MNYYFCDVCHYCFEAESLPDRCPDCGKVKFQERLAVRAATEKEIQDLPEQGLKMKNKRKEPCVQIPHRRRTHGSFHIN